MLMFVRLLIVMKLINSFKTKRKQKQIYWYFNLNCISKKKKNYFNKIEMNAETHKLCMLGGNIIDLIMIVSLIILKRWRCWKNNSDYSILL